MFVCMCICESDLGWCICICDCAKQNQNTNTSASTNANGYVCGPSRITPIPGQKVGVVCAIDRCICNCVQFLCATPKKEAGKEFQPPFWLGAWSWLEFLSLLTINVIGICIQPKRDKDNAWLQSTLAFIVKWHANVRMTWHSQ